MNADYWDALHRAGSRYRTHHGQEADLLFAHAGDGRGLRALEIACGTGAYTARLTSLGYSVTGVDFAPTAIEKARAAHPELKFVEMDFERGDLDGLVPGFDLIACRLAYAFMVDKPAFLRRVQSLLAPGGIFHVVTPRVERLPADRAAIGITDAEHDELCAAGWSNCVAHDIDALTCYFLYA